MSSPRRDQRSAPMAVVDDVFLTEDDSEGATIFITVPSQRVKPSPHPTLPPTPRSTPHNATRRSFGRNSSGSIVTLAQTLDDSDDELLLRGSPVTTPTKKRPAPSQRRKETPTKKPRPATAATKATRYVKVTPIKPPQRTPITPPASRQPKATAVAERGVVDSEEDEEEKEEVVVTPVRSSLRNRGLPADTSGIKIEMVGFSQKFRYTSDTSSDEESVCDGDEDGHEQAEEEEDEAGSEVEVEGVLLPATNALSVAVEVEAGEVEAKMMHTPEDLRRVLDNVGKPSVRSMKGYEKWESPIQYAMRGVVKDKVGNCVIVLGQHGIGKSLVTENALTAIEEEFGADSFIPVRLNGLVHTTDRQALRSIARQLKVNGFEDDDADWGSNASTMATLLSMLEPSATSGNSSEKAVLLVLDGFDIFALHPRQSFLYCLLDIVQGNRRKAGMGVIGLSSRTDCLSLLEKRVRSRCQSQVIQMVLDNSWSSYLARALALLTVDVAADDATAVDWNEEVKAFLADAEVIKYLERLWRMRGSSPSHLVHAFTAMRAKIEWSTRHTAGSWKAAVPTQVGIPRLGVHLLPPPAPAGRQDLLRQRTNLELTVCIAAKHIRQDHGALNLEMIYDCYLSQTRRARTQDSALAVAAPRVFTKAEFSKALDSLRELELFIPATGKPSAYFVPSLADSFRMLRFVPWSTEVQDVVAARADLPQPMKKWCKMAWSA